VLNAVENVAGKFYYCRHDEKEKFAMMRSRNAKKEKEKGKKKERKERKHVRTGKKKAKD
jgi:hypothetical protein